jgi:hypothetical protein
MCSQYHCLLGTEKISFSDLTSCWHEASLAALKNSNYMEVHHGGRSNSESETATNILILSYLLFAALAAKVSKNTASPLVVHMVPQK